MSCDSYVIILNCFISHFILFLYFVIFIAAMCLYVLQNETQTKHLKSDYLCETLKEMPKELVPQTSSSSTGPMG